MNYTDWVNAIGGQAANLPGQTLSLWCLEEDQYFDINFEFGASGRQRFEIYNLDINMSEQTWTSKCLSKGFFNYFWK